MTGRLDLDAIAERSEVSARMYGTHHLFQDTETLIAAIRHRDERIADLEGALRPFADGDMIDAEHVLRAAEILS